MDLALFHSYWTVVLLVIFVAIWKWAWSARRSGAFDAAARLPLEDDQDTDASPPGAHAGRAATGSK